LFDRHEKTLRSAHEAIGARTYFSAYPEIPSGKIYGETAKKDGLAAYQARLNSPFQIDQPGTVGTVGAEVSPFGPALGVKYPQADLDVLLPAAGAGVGAWADAGIEARVGVCLEILHRINQESFQLANAVMHTTGQGFMMAFQAGGPHAQDRGLEAVAYAYDEMTRTPDSVVWTKQVGKEDFVHLEKTFCIVPRGVSVVVGCSTFPTWNSYPGLFASLATGNAVVIKPHPGAVLPLAITVEIARHTLAEQGFDPNLVTLVADTHDEPVTKKLVTRPEVDLVDYTGSTEFGDWIEQNARQAIVFTEKAGVNSVIVDSTDDMRAMCGNLAFTVSLYSGQMCTTSQNIFIPKDGIETGDGRASVDDFTTGLVKAINGLLGDAGRAAEVLGAIQSERTVQRIDEAAGDGGKVLRESEALANEHFPEARVHSPLIIQIDAERTDLFQREMFGPIVYVVVTDDTDHSISLATQIAREQGAITCAAYSTDAAVLQQAQQATAKAGVALSSNLTGHIFVNQSAAFSDFHMTGANPAGNSTLTDSAFVSRRFRVVQNRIPVAQPAAV
jgi:phenylacetic acid degradation protein paaN